MEFINILLEILKIIAYSVTIIWIVVFSFLSISVIKRLFVPIISGRIKERVNSHTRKIHENKLKRIAKKSAKTSNTVADAEAVVPVPQQLPVPVVENINTLLERHDDELPDDDTEGDYDD